MRLAELTESSSRMWFHCTPKTRLRSIMQHGIEPNRKRVWKNRFGATLGERGLIYLLNDFTEAVRWAAKMEWEHKLPIVILCMRTPPDLMRPDTHMEFGYKGSLTTTETIPPEVIIRAIPLTLELKRQVVNDGKASLPR